ncbi:SARP family transcriptional regulator [Deinococcus phoenicis]|uniref:SARP family transcriptional regulator n=1 Tax=Deinococcus phoenicis TaxID=1476583 RepID=A0A016QMB6_9DEIO|nr:SARP family transcriptional regulator [Deinococcus phoenicis]EYB67290.1 SARP family transcriptional regulator [Deinococcus phoenicis]
MDDLEGQFEAGQFTALVTLLEGKARTAREHTLLGLSLLYTGRLEEAELSLTRASLLGDAEGQVELGNALRLLGRFEEAITHLQALAPDLTGELQLRCLRWWGVAEFQAGQTQEGLKRVERAWHGYIALGNEEWTGRVTVSLAQMYIWLGNHRRARLLLSEAVEILPSLPDPAPRLGALKALLELQIAHGEFGKAREILADAKSTLAQADSLRLRALLMTSEAELLRLSGDYAGYLSLLEDLRLHAEGLQDHNLRVWSISRLAEHQSLIGQHSQALYTLLGFERVPAEWPAELWATSGVLARRRGDLLGAAVDLGKAAQMFRDAGNVPELVRAQLHLAAAALPLREEATVISALKEALTHMLRLRQLTEFRPDLEELNELLHYAVLEPETAPYMEPLLDNLAHLAGAPRLPEDGAISVQVTTLGWAAVRQDGQEVKFTYAGTLPILVYIALKPGRTRAEMQLELFPEKDAKSGAAYMRQCLKELRDRLGPEIVRFEGPHQAPWYALGREVHVDLDLQHFREALERGEVARALALYRGPFLPELEDSEWAQQLRDETLLSLTLELRKQMAQYQAGGDFRRVVLIANQYLRVDPHDPEVLEARLKAAEVFAPPHELAKYTAALSRMFN